MPSKDLQTKELQKSRIVELAEARKNALKEKGSTEQEIAKDPKIKHFKAKMKQIAGAVSRIAFLEEQTKKLLEKKEQKMAEAAAERAEMIAGVTKKKAKKEEEPAPAAKGKKKGGGGKAPAAGGKAPAKKKGK